jgi:hypothetical protein
MCFKMIDHMERLILKGEAQGVATLPRGISRIGSNISASQGTLRNLKSGSFGNISGRETRIEDVGSVQVDSTNRSIDKANYDKQVSDISAISNVSSFNISSTDNKQRSNVTSPLASANRAISPLNVDIFDEYADASNKKKLDDDSDFFGGSRIRINSFEARATAALNGTPPPLGMSPPRVHYQLNLGDSNLTLSSDSTELNSPVSRSAAVSELLRKNSTNLGKLK